MNIIGNSCIASFLTKNYLHEQFNNPFCWCILDFNSIYNLIQNYNDINFLNIDFIHRADNTFSIVVDNLVTIRYPHYILDFTAKNILYDGPNIRYYRIYEYIYEKYINRVTQMLQQKIKPIFVLGEYYNNLNDHENHLTFNEVELLKTLTIYKIFIIQPDLQNSSTKNVKIINNITYVDEPHENAAKAFYNLYVNELI